MECTIYNVWFQRYAKQGHSNEDSVEAGEHHPNEEEDGDEQKGGDRDHDWWIIKPVSGKENCFT